MRNDTENGHQKEENSTGRKSLEGSITLVGQDGFGRTMWDVITRSMSGLERDLEGGVYVYGFNAGLT